MNLLDQSNDKDGKISLRSNGTLDRTIDGSKNRKNSKDCKDTRRPQFKSEDPRSFHSKQVFSFKPELDNFKLSQEPNEEEEEEELNERHKIMQNYESYYFSSYKSSIPKMRPSPQLAYNELDVIGKLFKQKNQPK